LIVVGLTGSIGMGKSTAAMMLRRLRVPVHDADGAVHRLLGPGGGAVAAVAAVFPEALAGNRIDRRRLGDLVFGDTPRLRRLEGILHPLVRRSSRRFLMTAASRRAPVAVLDIPLLFESRGEGTVDTVVVVSAPAFIQRQRVMARPGMTAAKFHAILARQLPDCEKRRRADFVIRTGGPLGETFRQLRAVIQALKCTPPGRPGGAWSPSRRRRHADQPSFSRMAS
jgi:dephospho-CoA kinase